MIDPVKPGRPPPFGLWNAFSLAMLKPICECVADLEAAETQLQEVWASPFKWEEKGESDRISSHSMSEDTDEELVLLARQGDRDAFARLTRRYVAACLKRARLILRNESDAEDEVQNAFAKAFECLEQFRFEGPFSAWLNRIVQNQCLMLIRERREAEMIHVDMISENGIGLELIDQLADQEHEMGRQQVENLLRKEISRVPPVMRRVIMLRYLEELPMPEVAAQLHLSVPAAKSRLMRARRELRHRLVKYCGHSGPRTLISRPARNKTEPKYVG